MINKNLKVAVLGAGAMGCLFGGVLSEKGLNVILIDVWKEHVESFGFGNYLNNDFNSGQKGSIPKSSHWDEKYPWRWISSTILSMSIGQGELECTPIQMANLTATIANRGFYYIPHIIKEIENDTIPLRFSEKQHTSIAPQHFETVIDGMEQVLSNIGLGYGFKTKTFYYIGYFINYFISV